MASLLVPIAGKHGRVPMSTVTITRVTNRNARRVEPPPSHIPRSLSSAPSAERQNAYAQVKTGRRLGMLTPAKVIGLTSAKGASLGKNVNGDIEAMKLDSISHQT